MWIKGGLDGFLAYEMGRLNGGECFGLKRKGGIAGGYDGDFMVV
ncbi:hypothetical protein [Bacillus pumilus]